MRPAAMGGARLQAAAILRHAATVRPTARCLSELPGFVTSALSPCPITTPRGLLAPSHANAECTVERPCRPTPAPTRVSHSHHCTREPAIDHTVDLSVEVCGAKNPAELGERRLARRPRLRAQLRRWRADTLTAMRRFAAHTSWLVTLCCAACAGPATPSAKSPQREPAARSCSSFVGAGVSAASAERLEHASNLIEYENIWKTDHPGATSSEITAGAVRSLIHTKLSEVQACYEAARGRAQGSGRVVVRFVIDSEGQVATAQIAANSFDVPEVSCCLVEHIARWEFPRPSANGFVVVEYPFVVRFAASS
jgi:TonB family protein